MKGLSIGLASVLLLTSAPIFANTVAGYPFENYQAPIYKGKKAKLNYASSTTAKYFKTRLTDAYNYKGGEIGFGGSYVVAMWGCGASCISGAMIDKRTGKVYDLPIGEEGPYDDCYTSENSEDERINFEPNSRLFITRSCKQTDNEGTRQANQTITYVVKVWDEKNKKFVKLKEVVQTKNVKIE